jgi:hypothetical protein
MAVILFVLDSDILGSEPLTHKTWVHHLRCASNMKLHLILTALNSATSQWVHADTHQGLWLMEEPCSGEESLDFEAMQQC